MIESIKIQNLRSISNSEDIVLKPIMILLGANSSGKSSFLRSFPLFTQSVDKNLRGPISWFDSSFVDYGDYKTAKNKYAPEEEGISFGYKIKNFQPIIRRHFHYDYVDGKEFGIYYVQFTLKGDSKGTYVSGIHIETAHVTFDLKVNGRNENIEFYVDGKLVDISEKFRFNFNTGFAILPSIIKNVNDSESASATIARKIIGIFRKHCDRRLQNTSRLESILIGGSFAKEEFLARVKYAGGIKSFQKSVKNWNTSTSEFRIIYQLYLIMKLNSILESTNAELATFYHQCDYIAPMRAEAGRYYRIQGLQVQSVDPSGHNLLEFVASLTPKEKANYDDFMHNILGITVDVPSESGMKSLRVKTGNGDFSIADVGYGYSQIIPVITKLWHTAYVNSNNGYWGRLRFREVEKSTILMEQPELHLHPAMQAKVADTFIKVVEQTREGNECATLIVETHSQAIINRLGRRIREGVIHPDDINVLLFEKDKKFQNTIIKQISFTENGQLKDWPYGFFDPQD